MSFPNFMTQIRFYAELELVRSLMEASHALNLKCDFRRMITESHWVTDGLHHFRR